MTLQEKEELILNHLPLVHSLARRFHGPKEDFLAAGRLGLVRAAERFDPRRGSFGCYAAYWVLRYIHQEAAFRRSLLSVPPETDRQSHLLEPERRKPRHLKAVCARHFERADLALLADRKQEDPASEVERKSDRLSRHARLLSLFRILPDRWRKILVLRYGLEGEPASLQRIAEILGVTKERVRQIEAKALLRLSRRLGRDSSLEAEREVKSKGTAPPDLSTSIHRCLAAPNGSIVRIVADDLLAFLRSIGSGGEMDLPSLSQWLHLPPGAIASGLGFLEGRGIVLLPLGIPEVGRFSFAIREDRLPRSPFAK